MAPLNGREHLLIDDRTSLGPMTSIGSAWRLVSDQVMGGISAGTLKFDQYQQQNCLRLEGRVSTENNGGFIQLALSLNDDGPFDASAYKGVQLTVAGNGERYNLHLRTTDLHLPWQSFRAEFISSPAWQTLTIPFSEFQAYRTDRTFHPERLKRIGLVAIGKDFDCDLFLADIRLIA